MIYISSNLICRMLSPYMPAQVILPREPICATTDRTLHRRLLVIGSMLRQDMTLQIRLEAKRLLGKRTACPWTSSALLVYSCDMLAVDHISFDPSYQRVLNLLQVATPGVDFITCFPQTLVTWFLRRIFEYVDRSGKRNVGRHL